MERLSTAEQQRIRELFQRAPFIRHLGVELTALGPGWCETRLTPADRQLQQDGFVHAGVLSTLADHTGGGAGWTCTPDGRTVLSVEFKITFLRPAPAAPLRCRAEVVRAGRNLIFTEVGVFTQTSDGERQVARLSQTLAVVDAAVGAKAPGGGQP